MQQTRSIIEVYGTTIAILHSQIEKIKQEGVLPSENIVKIRDLLIEEFIETLGYTIKLNKDI